MLIKLPRASTDQMESEEVNTATVKGSEEIKVSPVGREQVWSLNEQNHGEEHLKQGMETKGEDGWTHLYTTNKMDRKIQRK